MPYFTGIPFWRILNNYLVDFLWFASFSLFMHVLNERPLNYIFCIVMAVLSEFFQLLFPRLGTFDFCDLLLYGLMVTTQYIFAQYLCKK